jgi:hypothetical protein
VITLHRVLHGLQKLVNDFLGRSLCFHCSRIRSRKKQHKGSAVDCGVLFSASAAEMGSCHRLELLAPVVKPASAEFLAGILLCTKPSIALRSEPVHHG